MKSWFAVLRGKSEHRLTWPAVLALVVLASSFVDESTAAGQDHDLPPFERVAAAVQRHFETLDYYQAGDLISLADVQDALEFIGALGWQVRQRDALLKRILPEEAFLVRKLRAEEGERFMRAIGGYPNAYDRLDRLSAMSGGRKLIDTLIRDKGGHELIEYLTSSQGGANLGKKLAQAKDGSDLNKPTSRIYTLDSLLESLAKLYQQEVDAAESDPN